MPVSVLNQLQSRGEEEDHRLAKTRKKMKPPCHQPPSIHLSRNPMVGRAAEDGGGDGDKVEAEAEVEALVLLVG